MSSITVEVASKSLIKHGEELCGDKVEMLKTSDSNIIILADGMGSGVKANILSTLTSKILGTMFLGGAQLEECVQTIIKTLPVCKIRHAAYSTFSILQIFNTGEVYLVEFDNPACVCIQNGALATLPYQERVIEGKAIREARFYVGVQDCLILTSDGVTHAGVGHFYRFGWSWENMAAYAAECALEHPSAARFASMLCTACDAFYQHSPEDDTTVAVARIIEQKLVNIFTGPPLNKEDDEAAVAEFMSGEAKRIVSGGTSASIVARVLKKEVRVSLDYTDPQIPPLGYIDGIDLVTEGILTLARALQLMRQYVEEKTDAAFFRELDKANAGSMIAKTIIEDCTELHMYVGRTVNEAYQNPGLPLDLSIRVNLVSQISDVVTKMGKNITIKYY